jgi:hypothetical protein
MPRRARERVEQQVQAVKLIKKDKPLEPRAKIQFAMNPNKWSREVKTWISEFQKHRRVEPLPAFDRLFNSSVKLDGETLEKESL